jgi:hypothetical protein
VSIQTLAYNAGVASVAYLWLSQSVAPPFLYYKF